MEESQTGTGSAAEGVDIFGTSPDGSLPVQRFWLPSEQTRSWPRADGSFSFIV